MSIRRLATTALFALLTAVPAATNEYVVYPIRYTLVVKWMIAGAAICTPVPG